ncbi:MAG TPA: hypothetical protein VEF90_17835 [Xanthobacteraceae bacterium]|nr:hypothetical protein [Xanthobacteraceae bacterium]
MTDVNPDDEHARLVDAIPRHMRKDGTVNLTTLGAEFGLHRSNMKPRVVALAVSGALGTLPVLPGFCIKSTSAQYRGGEFVGESVKQVPEGDITERVPKGFAIKGVSTLRDAHGRTIVEWTKTREEPSSEDAIAAIKAAFENYQPAAPTTVKAAHDYADCLTLFPLPDMHIGMFSWGKETDTDWDLKIAQRVIVETMEKVAARTAPSKVAVVLVGGDATHSDTNENRTANSGNILQVDGRYDKIIDVTQKITVRQIELCLEKHETVEVRVLKGNHDYHTSVAIAHFLKAWYRNEPRVVVDTSPSLFWWRRFGKVFLAATHGHETKARDMPMAMAVRRPEMWGATKHRYAHVFHVHHKEKLQDTLGGVIVESHEAPCPQDAWHYGQSFLSGRSLCSIAYDPERGESGRITENL